MKIYHEMYFRSFSLSLLLSGFVCCILFSQEVSRDVLYLKNGSVIKGQILEIVPEKTVKIKTADGSIFVFQISEVERIVKEETHVSSATQPTPQPSSNMKTTFGVFGGVGLPVGDFASTSLSDKAGYAKLGFSLGMRVDVPLSPEIGLIIDGSYIANGLDEGAYLSSIGGQGLSISSSYWSMIALMGGMKFGSSFYGAAQIGVSFTSSAGITLTGPGGSANINSASATPLTYAFSVGYCGESAFLFSLRYISCTPKYTISGYGPGVSISVEGEQPTSVITAVVGVRI